MHKNAKEDLRVRLKFIVLEYAKLSGSTKACRELDVPRSSFYRMEKKYEAEGPSGLYRKKPIPFSHPQKTFPEIFGKI